MHPVRRQRLTLVLLIVVASTLLIGLIVYALRMNFNMFYPPAKIIAGEAPIEKTIRAGGCVVPGSIVRATDSLTVRFSVTDGKATLPVTYTGILPDLFDEGEAAVLTGKLREDSVFVATEVLAKHDETYTPAEVSDTLSTDTDNPAKNYSRECRDITLEPSVEPVTHDS